jgi:hypothetical protein
MNMPLPENYLQNVMTLQKMSLESTLNFVSMIQKVAENSIQQAVSQVPWIPKEGKLMVENWVEGLNSGRTALEKVLRDSINQMRYAGPQWSKKQVASISEQKKT